MRGRLNNSDILFPLFSIESIHGRLQISLQHFDHHNLPRQCLTRILNDAGAAVNAIVPWSVSGVFIASTLQVDNLAFIPFAVFPTLVTISCIIAGFSTRASQATSKAELVLN